MELEMQMAREELRRRYPQLPVADGYTRNATSRNLPWHVAGDAARGVVPDTTETLVIDTACSSGLTAVDVGMRSLWHGEHTLAICAGTYAVTPLAITQSAYTGGQSQHGQIRPFDHAADGILFADGAAAVALKPLLRARQDGDRILGVLIGSGISNDGRGKVMNAPNAAGQSLAITRALAAGDVEPGSVGWVVGHGSGTPVGDISEVTALADAYPCGHRYLTSNKNLIGHGSASAGPASLIHALLGLQHHCIPAQHHHTQPAPTLPLGNRITVPTKHTPWPARSHEQVAAVSGFGVGGTNVHVLLTAEKTSHSQAGPQFKDSSIVIVAWGADLPGQPPLNTLPDWLRNRAPAPPLTYQPDYPPVRKAEFLLPPTDLRATDHTQICSLRLYRTLSGPLGTGLHNLHATTGVFAAHCGPTRTHARNALQCHLAALRAPTGSPGSAALWDQAERHIRDSISVPNTYSLVGSLANTIAARVANYFDLHGPAMTIDAGLDSGLAALRTAGLYLDSGAIDVAFLIAISSGGRELTNVTTDIVPPSCAPAEGAFALLLTLASTADSHGWPVLCTLPALPTLSSPLTRQRPDVLADRSYLAADSLIALLLPQVAGRS
ncbi:beta-ketoacyl synthase N-terminal-like domain-containing protein [Streptomyces sp. NPDC007205]|uniref:beta-ketoacyl [acyl carrier protein] synthase domain-containing protein n=1 Tax=Streptomyces sp. NPDC007205 TaxID=3154316 RepID=UPI0033CE50CF